MRAFSMLLAVALGATSALPLSSAAAADPSSASPTLRPTHEVRSIPAGEFGIDGPSGLVWNGQEATLTLLQARPGAMRAIEVSVDEEQLSTTRLGGVADSLGVSVDLEGVYTAVVGQELRRFGPRGVESEPIPGEPLEKLAGAVHEASGTLAVLDGAAVVRVDREGNLTTTPVQHLESHDLRGLVTRAGSDLVYTYDATGEELVGISSEGETAERYDLAQLDLRDVAGIAVAPSADRTDAPTTESLFILDGGDDDERAQIVEVALEAQAVVVIPPVDGTVVRVTDTSQFAPPSPDPSGIVYVPSADRLMISDGEVNEMSIFEGSNLFLTTASGSLESTGVSQPWSDEPVGVGYDSLRNHLLVSDDDDEEVYRFVPGADGQFGTGDDTVTHFDTLAFGNSDPEGVEFDPVTDTVWTVDGLDREVFQFDPGPDQTYGTADDLHTNFDVGGHGALDPEGLGYDSVRDTLVIVDDNSDAIYELDRTGALLNTISTASADMDNAAGVTVAPASQDPSQRSYYVVARFVDNDRDPNENDGKMFEFAADLPPVGGNRAPVVDAGVNQVVVLPAEASLDGSVSDDGLPDPPAAVMTAWSQVSGPGTVTFGDAGAVDTTASFSAAGSYVLRLSADDGALVASDEVTVTVQDAGGGGWQTVEVQVAAGSDDAEQRASGSMSLSSSDLELTTDGSNQQVVGVRFDGLTVPPGATVTRAWVQFRADETGSGPVALTIRAESADDAPTYSAGSGNITARSTTAASVAWSPPAWNNKGEAGSAQQTPDLAGLVQAVVGRAGWQQGNAVALQISGTGTRTADSFEGGAAFAPLLHVEYTTE